MMRPGARLVDGGATRVQVQGELNDLVSHRFVVWQFEAQPGSQCGGEHAQALGRLLHESKLRPPS
jgi:hypothetical protein